ncbi:hypothetical protein Agub_g8430 [Astrephomene gubernaculifera]|uniref:Glycosyltransferase 2-like domain-containing protein n=1 Tax=Astrephomene gubernaculifera TaxID=47775 RepID=A0AAD3DS02_9CHLO|nr:hypothetical protein Agub_g8430 [Astrephomene gubernaculifera]
MVQKFLCGLLVLLSIVSVVLGGPDGQLLTYCGDLFNALPPEDRHACRKTYQSLQAVESHLGLIRLNRPLQDSNVTATVSNATALEIWKADNAIKTQQLLDGAGVAQRLGISPSAAVSLAAACFSNRLHPDAFAGRPLVSVLLNYFKRAHIISRIASGLRSACSAAGIPCELVVNVDNPHEADAWAAEVQSGLVVPVFSANLHEARGYNRAARAARGSYLVIWQDDQVPPADGPWLQHMIQLFQTFPQLGILGMNKYRLCRTKEFNNLGPGPTPWLPDPRVAVNPANASLGPAGQQQLLQGVSWTYAHLVDFAPMAVRASTYHALGGLEEGWTRPGDCGISGDWELCYRAWVAGWQVGYMFMAGLQGDRSTPSGTHKPNTAEACWGRQGHVGRHALQQRFMVPELSEQMCEHVWRLNMAHFSLAKPEDCPYGNQNTRWANCTSPAVQHQPGTS